MILHIYYCKCSITWGSLHLFFILALLSNIHLPFCCGQDPISLSRLLSCLHYIYIKKSLYLHLWFETRSPFMRGARNYDDLVSERFSRFGKDGECPDFSYQSATSCPSPTRSLIEHPSYHARQGHVDSGAQQSTWFFHHDEQLRSLQSSRSGGSHDDQMRSPKSSRSSGPSRSNGSGSGISSIGQLPSGSGTTDADGDSCSSNSLVCFMTHETYSLSVPFLFNLNIW